MHEEVTFFKGREREENLSSIKNVWPRKKGNFSPPSRRTDLDELCISPGNPVMQDPVEKTGRKANIPGWREKEEENEETFIYSIL